MDQTLFALPILPGETNAARAFLAELERERSGRYATDAARAPIPHPRVADGAQWSAGRG